MHGPARVGEIVEMRRPKREIDLRVDHTFHRGLPERPGALARLWRRLRPPRPEPPPVQTFAVPARPMATDAHSHPAFVRLVGGLDLADLKHGDQVIVVQSIPIGVLPDDPDTRARVAAAYDRSGDVAWAAAATVDELIHGLLERRRWDAALRELRSRRALDARGLLARVPAERVAGLQGVVGYLGPVDRPLFFQGAAEHLAGSADRTPLAHLVESFFDRTQLEELEPLILLLDRARPAEERLLSLARIRLERVLRDEPGRAARLARLVAHVRA